MQWDTSAEDCRGSLCPRGVSLKGQRADNPCTFTAQTNSLNNLIGYTLEEVTQAPENQA